MAFFRQVNAYFFQKLAGYQVSRKHSAYITSGCAIVPCLLSVTEVQWQWQQVNTANFAAEGDRYCFYCQRAGIALVDSCHMKWSYVGSAPERGLHTIGHVLWRGERSIEKVRCQYYTGKT